MKTNINSTTLVTFEFTEEEKNAFKITTDTIQKILDEVRPYGNILNASDCSDGCYDDINTSKLEDALSLLKHTYFILNEFKDIEVYEV